MSRAWLPSRIRFLNSAVKKDRQRRRPDVGQCLLQQRGQNNLNPEWESAMIQLSTLSVVATWIRRSLKVFDHEGSGRHVSMG